MSRRTHLVPSSDASAHRDARTDGADTHLLLSRSSATGGAASPGANFGGSILPEINVGGSVSQELMITPGLHFKDPLRREGAYHQEAEC